MSQFLGMNNHNDRLQVLATIVTVAFAVALALLLGYRLRGQAGAALIGMVGGMVATTLASLFVVTIRRRDEAVEKAWGGDPAGPVPLSQIPSLTDAESALAEAGYRRGYRDGWIQGAGAMNELMAGRRLAREAAYDVCWHHWETVLLPWTWRDFNRTILPPGREAR